MNSYLRLAKESDMELLFEWANEPLVRKNSFSAGEISYEEHKTWFWELMGRKDRMQYIYMCDGRETGQIRLGICGTTAEISYSICAGKRGQGHGTRMLKLLCEQVKEDFPQVLELKGKVKPENTASRKAFMEAGFREEKEADYVIYQNRYE